MPLTYLGAGRYIQILPNCNFYFSMLEISERSSIFSFQCQANKLEKAQICRSHKSLKDIFKWGERVIYMIKAFSRSKSILFSVLLPTIQSELVCLGVILSQLVNKDTRVSCLPKPSHCFLKSSMWSVFLVLILSARRLEGGGEGQTGSWSILW